MHESATLTWRRRQAQRDPREVAFYGSSAWQRLRRAVLERSTGRCEQAVPVAGRDGRTVYWTCDEPCNSAGHIIPWRQRPDLGLDPDNVIAQCRRHQELAKYRDPGTSLPL